MPIKIPDTLPAFGELENERVPLIRETDAIHQDIRPLQFALLNLMPEKKRTETQLLRLLGSTPLQVEVTLIRTGSYMGKTEDQQHMLDFYVTLEALHNARFDGLIITGVPLAHVAYEDVAFWPEMQKILNWSQTNVYSTFTLCWGAHAALYHFHGLGRALLAEKQFGVYAHDLLEPNHPLTRGLDDVFNVPVARYSYIPEGVLQATPELEILARSDECGACLAYEPDARRVYMFNHLEYDGDSLKREYERDIAKGHNIAPPVNYFPGNDPAQPPRVSWRSARNLLFRNWISEVYQGTPFDLSELDGLNAA
jgi:homoserine O-succinyltransferase